MTQAILMVGAGGHAAACIDVIESTTAFAVAGLVGRQEEIGSTLLGYPVLACDDDLADLLSRYQLALVTVGQITQAEPRMRLFERLTAHGFSLPTVVSARAHVSRHATLGEGTIVMHGATVNARATVGRNCIINSHALIEHDAVIGDHCHVSTGAIVNGGTRVGSASFIGSNSTLRHGITLGERCVVGMGQGVLNDCASGAWIPTRQPGS